MAEATKVLTTEPHSDGQINDRSSAMSAFPVPHALTSTHKPYHITED